MERHNHIRTRRQRRNNLGRRPGHDDGLDFSIKKFEQPLGLPGGANNSARFAAGGRHSQTDLPNSQ
jgi:hypothetical protein